MFQLKKTFASALACVIFSALCAPAAMAGVGLGCTALDGSKAEINIALAGGVGFSALSADATDGKTVFTGSAEKGTTQFFVAQGMLLGDAYYADFSDDNAERIIISLRVNAELLPERYYAKLDEDFMPGKLTFEGQKPIPVECSLG